MQYARMSTEVSWKLIFIAKMEKITNFDRWISDEWGPCNRTCGGGMRERLVVCAEESNGARHRVPDEACRGTRPKVHESCNTHDCPKWVTSDWSGVSKMRFFPLLLGSLSSAHSKLSLEKYFGVKGPPDNMRDWWDFFPPLYEMKRSSQQLLLMIFLFTASEEACQMGLECYERRFFIFSSWKCFLELLWWKTLHKEKKIQLK